ncbi:Uncharacterised protein [Vibrio cholerae]|nr:Uncharacterised protein [Vibrio cholerae]
MRAAFQYPSCGRVKAYHQAESAGAFGCVAQTGAS